MSRINYTVNELGHETNADALLLNKLSSTCVSLLEPPLRRGAHTLGRLAVTNG